MEKKSLGGFIKTINWNTLIPEILWDSWRIGLGILARLAFLACWNGFHAFLMIGKGFAYDGFSSLTDRQLMESTLLLTSLSGLLNIMLIFVIFLIWLTYKYHDKISGLYGRRNKTN